jgi:hypothetical protein
MFPFLADQPISITCHKKSANGGTTMLPPKIPPPFHNKEDDKLKLWADDGRVRGEDEGTRIIAVSHGELSK